MKEYGGYHPGCKDCQSDNGPCCWVTDAVDYADALTKIYTHKHLDRLGELQVMSREVSEWQAEKNPLDDPEVKIMVEVMVAAYNTATELKIDTRPDNYPVFLKAFNRFLHEFYSVGGYNKELYRRAWGLCVERLVQNDIHIDSDS